MSKRDQRWKRLKDNNKEEHVAADDEGILRISEAIMEGVMNED